MLANTFKESPTISQPPRISARGFQERDMVIGLAGKTEIIANCCILHKLEEGALRCGWNYGISMKPCLETSKKMFYENI